MKYCHETGLLPVSVKSNEITLFYGESAHQGN